jgi:hypothetical protein
MGTRLLAWPLGAKPTGPPPQTQPCHPVAGYLRLD